MNVYSKLMICFSAAFFVGTVNAQNVHGVLRVVKGDVQVKNSKGETAKARIGGKVFPKDIVITGKDARAKIVMVDNNEINVSPDSQIEIQHYEYDPAGGKKDVLLNVIYGKVRSKVEQKYDGKTSKFQIKTPSAVAGVRGTDFMMGFNKTEKTSQVVTFEGKVEFGTPGPGGSIQNPVFVSPGMTAAVNSSGAAPSAPAPMPKDELAKMDKDSAAEPPKAQGPNAPANDQRAPAEDKKDGAKNDGNGAPGAGGAVAGDAPAGGSGGGDQGNGNGPRNEEGRGNGNPNPGPVAKNDGAGRGPASESSCTMCGGAPPPMVAPPIAPVVPPSFNFQNPGAAHNNAADQFVRDTIKGGNTNLIIRVK